MNANENQPQHEDELQQLAQVQTRIDDTLLQSVAWVCQHYGQGRSHESLVAGLAKEALLSPSLALTAFENAGFTSGLVERPLWDLPLQVTPIVLVRKGSGGCVLLDRVRRKNAEDKMTWFYTVIMPEVSNDPVEIEHAEISEWYSGYAIMSKPKAKVDRRVVEGLPENQKHWLFSTLWRYRRYYRSAAIASVLVNVLALASIFFTMNVYDRVIPNQAFVTLWSLAIGVTVAMLFEAVTRYVRAHLLDTAGKKADLIVGSLLFRQALSVRMENKPQSSGTFANQLREFESVREFVSSATLAALADLPFFLLFTVILWMIGGPLVFVVLLAIPLLLIPGLLIQKPLAKLASEGMRESAVRNASLVEAVESLEDIKLMRAEQRFQNQWNHCNEVSADISMRQRFLTSLLMTWTQEVQSIVYAIVLLVGCYLVMNGDMTTGALVGTTILASRTIAPLAQISGVLSRWQQAKVARKGLDELMQRPIDREDGQKMVHKAQIAGEYQLNDAVFYYDEEEKVANLAIARLKIAPGEKIAVLGKNGAGKSTLLQVLAGMQQVQQGQVVLDNVNIKQIDPADLRRDVALHNQHARLFFGSVRDNITMGRPQATDEEIHQALIISGALPFVQQKENGLNFLIHEGGVGLSGGQRQALLLARHIIMQPQVLLLDEPTAWLDEISEANLIHHLSAWGKNKTLVIATHRLALLQLVDRIVVMDNGRITLDGSKDEILNKHFRPKGQPAQAVKPANKDRAS